MKKFISLAISLLLVIGMMPISASAEIQTVTQDGITYEIDTQAGTAYVFDVNSDITTANILSEVNGYPVTSIGEDSFFVCISMTQVTIPDSVTNIGDFAFCGCISLEKVVFPNSVTSIGDYAFGYCDALTQVVIPDSVTSIGQYAFSGCDSLTSINVSENNENYSSLDGALFNKDKTELLQCPGGIVGEYTIPDSVTSISEFAFSYCTSLTSIYASDNNENYSSLDGVLFNKNKTKLLQYPSAKSGEYTVPNSVISIGNSAFLACDLLTGVVIPDSVTSIGDSAFEWCNSLESITIGNSVTSIGGWAFNDTAYYNDTLNWENGVLYIDDYLIEGEYDVSGQYTVKDGTRIIADYAFYCCDLLTKVVIPNSVTTIGKWAFDSCYSLTEVVLPDSVISIGDGAFSCCTALTEVVIPDSVTSIGEWAFDSCTALTSITIGNSVTSIEYGAFCYCTALTEIVIPNSVTTIGEWAFDGCESLKSVTIGNSVTSIEYGAFDYCDSLTDVYYAGSESDWNNIYIEYANDPLNNATIHYNGGSEQPTTTVVHCYATQLDYDNSPMTVGETRAVRFYHPETLTASGADISEVSGCISYEYEEGSDTVYITALESGEAKMYIREADCAFGAYAYFDIVDAPTTEPTTTTTEPTTTTTEPTTTTTEPTTTTTEPTTTTTEPTTTTTTIPTEPISIQGDVNGDGKISIVDARFMLVTIANSDEIDDDIMAIADINGDKRLTIVDARQLLVKIANGEV